MAGLDVDVPGIGQQPRFSTPGLGQVQCHFGPRLKIRVENQQVLFSTEKDAPNQEEFVRQFLRNL